ncbi:MAG TPA: hypothetical protein VIU61_20155, partial [Kofleriaceae bacterium]
MPDLGTAGLEPAGAVQLTKSAELVMKTLIKQQVYAPSQTLDDEQKAIINAVVPTDLEGDELIARAKIMSGKSGAMTPIPQLVIEAMQQIRPDGKKRPLVHNKPPVPGSKAPLPKQRADRGATKAPAYLVIDLDGYVFDHAVIDAAGRSVTLPETVVIHGVTLERVNATVGLAAGRERDSYLVGATFKVTSTTGSVPCLFNDGTRAVVGIQTKVMVPMTKATP